MSQHDLTIDNQGFPAFRADLNNALQALGSTQSGTTAPSPTFANQLWYDTTNNQLKIRNEDNDAWIILLTLDQVADAVSTITGSTINAGALTASGNVSFDGGTFVFNDSGADKDFRIEGDTDANLFFTDASTDRVGIGTNTPAAKLDVASKVQIVTTNSFGKINIARATDSSIGGLYIQGANNAGTDNELSIVNAGGGGAAINVTGGDIRFYSGGVTTERLRLNDTGALVLQGGTTNANGVGIAFPATQSASSNANTLDDYEEGTFTPTMTFGGNAAFSSVTANGKYTKVGNVVTFEVTFTAYTKTANTGSAEITGMPFTFSDLQKVYLAQGDNLTYTSGAYLFCYNSGSGTSIYPYQMSAGSATQLTNSAFGNSGTFRVCGSYFTAT